VSIRDRILTSDDIPSELVEVPLWGVTLEVRGMTGSDRATMLKAAMTPEGGVDLQAFYPEIVIACSYDPETGERVFVASDRDSIMAKSGKAIDAVATVGLRLSGMTEDTKKDLGKDSSTTPSEEPTSN
jgi:hypothetical protein